VIFCYTHLYMLVTW